MKRLKRIFGNPLKCIGAISIGYGLVGIAMALDHEYELWPEAIFVLVGGCLVYVAETVLKTKTTIRRKIYWVWQASGTIIFCMTGILMYFYHTGSTTIILPDQKDEDALIVYGIEGYPELPQPILWRRIIRIPSNRILITSSKKEDLSYRKYRPTNIIRSGGLNSSLRFLHITQPCIMNEQVLVADYLSDCNCPYKLYHIPPKWNQATNEAKKILNSLSEEKLKSFYNRKNTDVMENKGSGIFRDGNGLHLDLRNWGWIDIPESFVSWQFYSVDLSGNKLSTIPAPIAANPFIQVLYINRNYFRFFPEDLCGMKSLRVLGAVGNKLHELPKHTGCLMQLDSLRIEPGISSPATYKKLRKMLPGVVVDDSGIEPFYK